MPQQEELKQTSFMAYPKDAEKLDRIADRLTRETGKAISRSDLIRAGIKIVINMDKTFKTIGRTGDA